MEGAIVSALKAVQLLSRKTGIKEAVEILEPAL